MNAIDTNVLVYAIDTQEPVKQQQALALLGRLRSSRSTVLLYQVAGEYLSCIRRFASTGRFPAADIEADMQDLLAAYPLALPTEAVFPKSLSLASRFSLSHWDSMLIAACVEAKVDVLYSEDLHDGLTYESVIIENPFS